MPTYERLDYGSPDGSQWGGTSSDCIGWFGTASVAQQLVAGGNVSTVTNVSTAVSSLIVALAAYGLIRLV